MSDPIIVIKNLKVALGGETLLDNINITINHGEIATIIGPNGAGKTTLLKAMLGLIPYSGAIKICGDCPRKALKKIGYIPQRFSFDKNFPITVYEFLELGISRILPEIIFRALKEVGMNEHSGALLGQLSGGELQRVLIARAILNEPELLLFDEPTAGVDIGGENDFYDIIKHQNTEHKATIVMVSHELSMVYAHATQVICLNKSLFCMGAPKLVVTNQILEQLYGKQIELRGHTH